MLSMLPHLDIPYIKSIPNDGSDLRTCIFSPDGNSIFKGTVNGEIQQLNIINGQRKIFQEYKSNTGIFSISSDGNFIVYDGDKFFLHLREIKNTDYQETFYGDAIFSDSWDELPSKLWDSTGHKIFRGHTAEVYILVLSPNGKFIFSVDLGQNIKLWDTFNGTCKNLTRHSGRVNACAFSSDSMYMVTVSADTTLRVWNVTNGAYKTLHGHTEEVNACAFSPNGKFVVSASSDSTLKIWEIATCKSRTLQGHAQKINTCAFSPDGQFIISGSDDNSLKIWHTKSGYCLRTLMSDNPIFHCGFSPDGNFILFADSRLIHLLDTSKLTSVESQLVALPQPIPSPPNFCPAAISSGSMTFAKLHTGHIHAIAFSPDGKFIVSAPGDHRRHPTPDYALILWDQETGDPCATFRGHGQAISACIFTSDGDSILSGSDDGHIIRWNLKGKPICSYRIDSPVTALALSPDGRAIASAGTHYLYLSDIDGASHIPILLGGGKIHSIAFSPNGKYVVAGTQYATYLVKFGSTYDDHTTQNLSISSKIEWQNQSIESIGCAFDSHGDSILAVTKSGNLIQCWTATGKFNSYIPSPKPASLDKAFFSPDRKLIACCSSRAGVQIMNSKNTYLTTLTSSSRIEAVAFSPNGEVIALGGESCQVERWTLLRSLNDYIGH